MTPLIKILIITTSHSALGTGGEQTGLWLSELTTPYYAFADAGAEVTIASIGGGAVPIDPRSLKLEGDIEESVKRYHADQTLRTAIELTPKFTAGMADDYDAIFLPGGHGTMWDYPSSADLAQVVVRFIEHGKPVAAVCHGPAGLVEARLGSGDSVVKGRRVAGFTNSEERAAGLETVVPFLLETRLRDLGATYMSGPDFQPFAVRDGALVTGQNPASAAEVARLTLEAVSERTAVAVE